MCLVRHTAPESSFKYKAAIIIRHMIKILKQEIRNPLNTKKLSRNRLKLVTATEQEVLVFFFKSQ